MRWILKILLYSYMVAMKNGNWKNTIYNSITTMRYLRINRTKEVWYLFCKNYNIFLRKVKDHRNKLSYIFCSWVRSLTIAHASILPHMNLSIQSNPNKNPRKIFGRNQEADSKISKERQRIYSSQTTLKKKNWKEKRKLEGKGHLIIITIIKL